MESTIHALINVDSWSGTGKSLKVIKENGLELLIMMTWKIWD